MTVKIKLGHRIFDIDERDLILDNGLCYQLITQEVRDGYFTKSPTVSKKLFSDLKKLDLIYTNDELKNKAIARYGEGVVNTFWKFDIPRMKELGY